MSDSGDPGSDEHFSDGSVNYEEDDGTLKPFIPTFDPAKASQHLDLYYSNGADFALETLIKVRDQIRNYVKSFEGLLDLYQSQDAKIMATVESQEIKKRLLEDTREIVDKLEPKLQHLKERLHEVHNAIGEKREEHAAWDELMWEDRFDRDE
ncbi:MAG: hypothetical protein Q9174_005225 [Haloplaca sp. 1 TL-2023]